MKKLFKLKLLILLGFLFFLSCATDRGIKQYEKSQKYSSNSSVLGLNAINADHNYYTKNHYTL